MRTLLVLTSFLAVSVFSCAPQLHLLRPTAPEGTFGGARTVALDVKTDMRQAVTNSVVGGLLSGEIPIPVPVHRSVREHLANKLLGLGYAVCPAAPCGDGVLTVRLLDSSVNSELTREGPIARVRIETRVVLNRADGQTPYDFSFWATRSGSAARAGALVEEAAEAVAQRFEASLLPGHVRITLPLEDGGPLERGVNLLLAGSPAEAAAYFSQLTQQQPELAGAHYDLGCAQEALGDLPAALASYQRAAGLDRKALYRDASRAVAQALGQ